MPELTDQREVLPPDASPSCKPAPTSAGAGAHFDPVATLMARAAHPAGSTARRCIGCNRPCTAEMAPSVP